MLIGIEAMHAEKLPRTGVEEYSYQIIEHLKKIIPARLAEATAKRASVQVVLYSKHPLTGALGALPSHWTNKVLTWPLGKLWSQIRLSFELFLHPPDVFFAPAQLIPFCTPKKTVTTLHDSAFLVFKDAYRFWGRQYLSWMNKIILKKSALILTPSQFTADELRRLHPKLSIPQTTVIPLAASTAKVSEGGAANFGITKKYILSVGRLEAKKNTALLVQAFAIVRKNADVQLVLAGTPGAGYEAVAAELAKSPYREDIITPGFVTDDALPALLRSAAVFVFPSLYEGFGLPLLEAMGTGVPIVASDIPPSREVAGEAATYVSATDAPALARAILAILDSPTEANRLRSLGFARAKAFSWEETAKRTYAAIAKLS